MVCVGSLPSRESRDRRAWLKRRILAVIDKGHHRAIRSAGLEDDNWWFLPGSKPYWAARQLVGGRVRADEFRAATEELLAEGELIEVWGDTLTARSVTHTLMRPGNGRAMKYPVVQVRGLLHHLQRDPSYSNLFERNATESGADDGYLEQEK